MEYSAPWDGSAIGDAAVLAPYYATAWDDLFQAFFGSGQASYEDFGVFGGYLNELGVSGVATPVAVATGAALVHGKWYLNDAAMTIPVPNTAAATRTDYVILRCDFTARTIRAVLLQNPVEGTGTPPALTQTDGTMWEIPIAILTVVNPGNAITVTDARRYLGIHPTDYFFPAQAFKAMDNAGIGGYAPPEWVPDTALYPYWAFDPATAEGAEVYWYMPPSVRGDITEVTLYWTGMATAGGNVRWVVGLVTTPCGVDANTSVYYHQWADTLAPTTIDILHCSALPAIGGNPVSMATWRNQLTVGGLVEIVVFRDAAVGADTYGSDAGLIGLRVRTS